MATNARPNAETVVEQTAEAIREAIREGRFAPGQRLVLADIMQMFQVSAGPAREAISRLAGERLVEIFPHRGAVVRSFSTEDIRDIFQVREVVEGLGARLAAEAVAASPEAARRMRESMDELDAVLDSHGEGYLEHNQHFHELIYELSANRRACEVARTLTLPIYRLRYHNLMEPSYVTTAAREHQAIAQAILAGDGDAAEAAMRAHIRHSADAMAQAVAARSRHFAPSAARAR